MEPPFTYKQFLNEALLPVKVDTGYIRYPCVQADINAYQTLNLKKSREVRSQDRVMEDFTRHLMQEPDNFVLAGLRNLKKAVDDNRWRPDIVVKALYDLDHVFFRGILRGKVAVQYVDGPYMVEMMSGETGPIGINGDSDKGVARIDL